ncbi:MAG: HAD family phosphatase [Candidatus Nanoarchaeia archaeon]|nr:HAD family phosphatase [Candidatus Nanoarchaeia archaeon]
MKAVVFDMDGTLVDSIEAHSRATTYVIEKISKELGYQKPKGYDRVIYRCFGKDYRTIIKEHVFPEISNIDNKKYEKLRNRHLIKHNLSYIKKLRGAKSVLKYLNKMEIKTAVASSSSRAEIDAFLKKTMLKKYIHKIIGRDEVEHAKPSPDMILLACRKLYTSPEDAVYVGDSEYDAVACRKASIRFIAVTTGQLSALKARTYTKDVFENLFQVKNYFKSFF